MLTAKMFAVQMKEFKFVFSQTAFIQTILYFAIIFIIVMIFNGITISKYKLINLLNSAKKNQKTRLKNPILSVILFLISIGILGIAYHLIQKNQMLAVDNDFKISVLLGVAGTFLFFFSLSGFLLELAKIKYVCAKTDKFKDHHNICFYVNAVFDAVFSNQCVCDRKWIGVFSENRFRRYDKV